MADRDHQTMRRAVAKAYGVEGSSQDGGSDLDRPASPDSIQHAAEAAGIRVHDDPDLFTLLAQVNHDAKIPSELYDIAGSALSWIQEVRVEFVGVSSQNNKKG